MRSIFFDRGRGRFLSCQSQAKEYKIFRIYFKHDSTRRPCALGYVDSTLMIRIADNGEDFALQANGMAVIIAGFLGSTAGFGKGMAGRGY